jgi:hypothetical protein
MLDVMADLAREARLEYLIAPVRPSFKDRYPITPIEQYMTWTREDGEPFDPWIRIHTCRGGKIVKPIPHSMRIAGTVTEWEEWTGMQFPGDGQYTFPAGLAPVEIDHRADREAEDARAGRRPGVTGSRARYRRCWITPHAVAPVGLSVRMETKVEAD